MIRRLTASTFALTLAVLLVVLFLGTGHMCAQVNDTLQEGTESICRLSAQWLNSAAFANEEPRSYLSSAAFASGTVIHVFSQNGTALIATHTQADPLTEEELSAALNDDARAMTRLHATYMADWIYSCELLEDGTVLRVSRQMETVSSILGEGRIVLYSLLIVLAAAAAAGTVYYCCRRTRQPLRGMSEVLENFAEGSYESRLPTAMAINGRETAMFNDVLSRLQERVFRQNTRNQALNAVMNSMETGMLAVDADLRILIVTPTAKKLLGITGNVENQLLPQAVRDVELEPCFREALTSDGVYSNTVAARTAVGRGKRPLRLYISPMRREGQTEGAVAMIEDITELRRLEQVRTDFAANVSHELKTPLTSIKGYVETLQDGAINNPEMAQRFLKIIVFETDRLTRLINDILSISKLESGEEENLPKERVDLRWMASDVSDMLRLQASRKDVTINMLGAQEPCYVLGNPDRTRQMLINLIENAIKYNKDGGRVDVTVQTAGNEVLFSCADTGIGVEKEHLDRLFERFYRVDKGRSRKMGGTGLGLAIVKHIVNSMGGHIEVQSTYGEGTEFLVTLPRMEAGAEEENAVNDDPFADA